MSNWVKYTHQNTLSFGVKSGNKVVSYDGNMFDNPSKTDIVLNTEDVNIKNPCQPSKMIALWNNYDL